MTDDADLIRLLGLRNRSEHRALEVLKMWLGAFQRAEHNVEEALAHMAQQAEEARDAERDLVELLLGRPASAATLGRFQAGCDVRAAAAADLRTIADKAKAQLRECEAALGQARASHRLLRRAASKLDLMVKRRMLDRDKRNEALAEALEEETVVMRSGTVDAVWI